MRNERRFSQLITHKAGLEAEGATDDLSHDLGGATADGAEAGVAQSALGGEFSHVSVAPMDLDALVGDVEGEFARVELRHRDLSDRILARSIETQCAVGESAARFYPGSHLCEAVAPDLELAHRPVERRAFQRVGLGEVIDPLRTGRLAESHHQTFPREVL